jgi:hypothetical protein
VNTLPTAGIAKGQFGLQEEGDGKKKRERGSERKRKEALEYQ